MATGSNKSIFTPIKIKQEPQENGIDTSIVKTERLTSFKVPRDLSLGGAGPLKIQKPAKKVFTPNLNAVRNKNAAVKNTKEPSTRGRGRPERGKNERGRGRGGGRGNLIQTSGVFSEGVGAINIRKSSSSSYRSNDKDDYESLRKPTINKKELKIDKNLELQQERDILGDSDDEDLDQKKISVEHLPIKLSDAKWATPSLPIVKIEKTENDGPEIKQEIKTESGNSESVANSLNFLKVEDSATDRLPYPKALEELFQRVQPQLFLMQLPDSLPGEDPESPKDTPGKSDDTEESAEDTKRCCLKQFDEGLIGKVIRYKSGKHKLILNETRFNLDLGMEPAFLQELMSINTNREERNGNMINMGPIIAKLTATPDWEYLFKKCT